MRRFTLLILLLILALAGCAPAQLPAAAANPEQWGRWSRVAANYVGALPPDVGSFTHCVAAPFPHESMARKRLPLSWGFGNRFFVFRRFATFLWFARHRRVTAKSW